ncbi:hypothetical protein ACWGJ2_07670 [Streptomyces sp. NPDC054796]
MAGPGLGRGDAEGAALAAPYGDSMVERGSFGGLQFGGAEGVGCLARHAEEAPGPAPPHAGERFAELVPGPSAPLTSGGSGESGRG